MSRRGVFLVLEGVEGVGKTTQAHLLVEWLRGMEIPHRLAREPGGTPVGEAIRRLLLEGGALEIPDRTELLLMLAARAAFMRAVVLPTLERGEVMVADRFELSTFAYQGTGRGLDIEELRRLNAFATGGIRPDLTLLLDLPVAQGEARQREAGKARDRIEEEGGGFLERVHEGYLSLAGTDPSILLVDASASPEEVHGRIRAELTARFPEPFGRGRG